jgi:hypothetical protein
MAARGVFRLDAQSARGNPPDGAGVMTVPRVVVSRQEL